MNECKFTYDAVEPGVLIVYRARQPNIGMLFIIETSEVIDDKLGQCKITQGLYSDPTVGEIFYVKMFFRKIWEGTYAQTIIIVSSISQNDKNKNG